MAACTGAEGTMSVAWLMQISEGTDQVFSTFIMESMFFLARYFSIVPCGPLSMRVWWPFQKNRTCIPFFGSGYAGLGIGKVKEVLFNGPAPNRSPVVSENSITLKTQVFAGLFGRTLG